MLGLYIHIPFCKSLCSYCDFCKFINQNEEKTDRYLDYLIEEINTYKDKFSQIDTIYIGGGTPNALSNSQLSKLFNSLIDINPVEFTIECNVEFITLKFIDLLKKTKVNRISIGVQTFNDRLIKIINRKHSYELAVEKIELLLENGYDNINLDMIYAIPTQTISELKSDLSIIKSLNVTHISYYSLILEPKSVFGVKYRSNSKDLIGEDLEADMNELVIDYLNDIGYKHYEISNFCRKNKYSIHNMLYWKREDYIGCGVSAAGYYLGQNILNSNIMSQYLTGIKESNYVDLISQKQEFFWLGLRLIDGVNLNIFKTKFNEDPEKTFEIAQLIEQGLVVKDGSNLKLTRRGILLGNIVFEAFLE